MPNRNYQRGYRVENRLVHHLKDRADCDIAQRMAGSHSPVDVIGFNTEERVIVVAQCKTSWEIISAKNTEILKKLSGMDWEMRAYNVWSDRKFGLQFAYVRS